MAIRVRIEFGNDARVRVRVALLAVLAAVSAGCSSEHGARTESKDASPLVAWSDTPVPELEVPPARPARPCRASDLRAGPGFVFQAAVVGATGTVELRNAGTRPCSLTGRPRVRFVGAPRAPAQRQVALPPQQPSFPRLRRPAAWLRSLAPGRSATLTIEWRNWCVPGAHAGNGVLLPPKAVRITFGGGSLDVDYNAVTRCEDPARPSTIGVRPFEAPILLPAEPWTHGLLSAKVLTLDGGGGPLRARRGEVLRYSVALRNAGRRIVRFGRCPFAVQLLAPAGATEAHRLNCAAAHALRPGDRIRLEMRIRVPQDAPLGANGLFWELDPLGAQSPEAVARVMVSA